VSERSEDPEIDPEQLTEWLAEDQPPQLIDVREPYEREAGYIDGSLHIGLAFRASGYEAYSLRGGLVRWAGENRPLSPEGGTVANH
jgi:rhodanese-related sulfurtransferase